MEPCDYSSLMRVSTRKNNEAKSVFVRELCERKEDDIDFKC